MHQLGFFDESRRVILADESGTIVYHRAALALDRAEPLFEHLRADTEWRSERRMMYDREVDVPRLVASVRFEAGIPNVWEDVLPIVETLSASRFNSIGLNLYRNGHDSVAPHNDRTDDLRDGFPIALLSLGSTRRMTIRSKALPKRSLDLDLEPGSLLVMSYHTQHTYDHAIPKTNRSVGERISVAFRPRRPLQTIPAMAT